MMRVSMGSTFNNNPTYNKLNQTTGNIALNFNQKNQQSVHLFVFVHGFQATSLDMLLLKANLLKLLPDSVVMLSCANEKKTD